MGRGYGGACWHVRHHRGEACRCGGNTEHTPHSRPCTVMSLDYDTTTGTTGTTLVARTAILSNPSYSHIIKPRTRGTVGPFPQIATSPNRPPHCAMLHPHTCPHMRRKCTVPKTCSLTCFTSFASPPSPRFPRLASLASSIASLASRHSQVHFWSVSLCGMRSLVRRSSRTSHSGGRSPMSRITEGKGGDGSGGGHH